MLCLNESHARRLFKGSSSNEGLTLKKRSHFSSGTRSSETAAALHEQSGSLPPSSDIVSREAARQQMKAHYSMPPCPVVGSD